MALHVVSGLLGLGFVVAGGGKGGERGQLWKLVLFVFLDCQRGGVGDSDVTAVRLLRGFSLQKLSRFFGWRTLGALFVVLPVPVPARRGFDGVLVWYSLQQPEG